MNKEPVGQIAELWTHRFCVQMRCAQLKWYSRLPQLGLVWIRNHQWSPRPCSFTLVFAQRNQTGMNFIPQTIHSSRCMSLRLAQCVGCLLNTGLHKPVTLWSGTPTNEHLIHVVSGDSFANFLPCWDFAVRKISEADLKGAPGAWANLIFFKCSSFQHKMPQVGTFEVSIESEEPLSPSHTQSR